MPIRPDLAKLKKPRIVLLGSGGLSIGQAGEFDYSGSQAVKSLLEEGAEVIVVNPNIATVQTNSQPGVKVYLYPVEPEWVEKVLIAEKANAIVAGFGGQTALNCVIKLDASGVLERLGVINLGTPVATLRLTEDRDLFATKMREIGVPVPSSEAAATLGQALEAASRIGYPVILRAAYALGGLGSGFASNDSELRKLVEAALVSSPQVLIERSLKGWKEVEYEVMRDSQGNLITICNMENFDPLGVHTGDSIVVAPSQTLSDEDYQILRNASLHIIRSLGVVGECNVQFALDTKSRAFYVIEVNARLSRSSALASKATGYPIAYIAAKVVQGYDLLELKNPVTGVTSAFFEPALDYVTVKIPRWDMGKFIGVNRKLGSAMKSVGEVMSIGRSFEEAIQKAVRMVSERPAGLSQTWGAQAIAAEVKTELEQPTDQRLHAIMKAFRLGMPVEEVRSHSAIDPWFLERLKRVAEMELEIVAAGRAFSKVKPAQWRRWKENGFGDEQIAAIATLPGPKARALAARIRGYRKTAGVIPFVKKIDTTAAEYPSPSSYLYMSYCAQVHDPLPDDRAKPSAVVLGSGAYRIGSSVEFDWCAVACSQELRDRGWRSLIVNCNPETVSTDFNVSDRLFFEEMTLERVLDVVEFEAARGVVVAMGGQLPNCLAMPLAGAGITLIGHSPESVDLAEDRSRFSALLDRLGIDQPRWTAATSPEDITVFVERVGFPVLVRPSYVLSGAAMNVAVNRESLDHYVSVAEGVSSEHPIVLSEFLDGAHEIELDGVAGQGTLVASVVSEHVEYAGIHSGDATVALPPHKQDATMVARIKSAGESIARELGLNGPFNIQFLVRGQELKVIECNARASRSFPFVSKVSGVNLARLATDVILNGLEAEDRPVKVVDIDPSRFPYVGVKAAMFSFNRLEGADPITGVEMTSTGEVGCLAKTFDEALMLALQATGVRKPSVGVLVSSGPEQDKAKFLAALVVLEELGVPVFATEGMAAYLASHGHPRAMRLAWPGEAPNDVVRAIREGWVDFVINIPKNLTPREIQFSSEIRKAAVRYGRTLFTDMEKVTAFLSAIGRNRNLVERHTPIALPPFRADLS